MLRLIIVLFVFPVFAFAQENLVEKKRLEGSKKGPGWHKKADAGVNISFGSSKDVVGQTDGDTATYKLDLSGNFNLVKERYEWQNKLAYSYGATKSPALPRFVKSADLLKYETNYLYFLKNRPWLGPYVKVSAEAPAFVGEDVRSASDDYNYTGTNFDNTGVGSARLTEGFKPLTTKESAGLFAKLINRKNTQLEIRIGAGALQVDADNQFAVSSVDEATKTVSVTQLKSFSQAGLEAGISFKGKWNDVSSYEIGVETLTPFTSDDDLLAEKGLSDYDDIELTNVEASAKASTKLSNWASLQYQYKAVRKPLLETRYQIQHGLVLNIAYSLIK